VRPGPQPAPGTAPPGARSGARPAAPRARPAVLRRARLRAAEALAARRPWHLAAGSVAAGLALAPAGVSAVLGSAAFIAVALAVLRAAPLGALCAALLLAGSAAGDARLAEIDEPAAGPLDGERVTLHAELLTRPRPSMFGASAEVRVTSGRLSGARLLLRIPQWARLPPRTAIGAELALVARVRALDGPSDRRDGSVGVDADPAAVEESSSDASRGKDSSAGAATSGSFDFAGYLRRRGIAGELLLDRARATGRRRGGLAGLLDRMRALAERGVAAGMPPREGALARGMVLGQDERIAEGVREDFRESGLAHLLAVSGQNVMLLGALALPVLAAAGLGPRGRAISLLLLIAVYVPLAGAGPSLQRAGIMGAAGIAAMTLSRPGSRWYALLLAAAATLALNPRATGDPGWQLSFAAVAGILTLGRPLQRCLRRLLATTTASGARRPSAARAPLATRAPSATPTSSAGRPAPAARMPAASGSASGAGMRFALGTASPTGRLADGLAEGAAISVAATLATAPLLAHHFGSVPLAGLPANLLALPAVAPAMWLGMVKAGLGQLAPVLPPADVVADALGPLARLPVAYLTVLAERFADVPGGQIALPPGSPARVIGAYALLVAAAAVLARAGRALRPRAEELAANWRRRPRAQRLAIAMAAVAALSVPIARLMSGPGPPGELTVRFLDVGQGDSTLIQHPDGTAVLFDGGPPEAGTVRLLRRAGVRRLSVVVATHASRDHHGGLPDVLDRYPVELLLDGGDGAGHSGFRTVLAEAASLHVRRVPAVAPMTIRAGGLRIAVLSPPARPPGPPPEDPNPRAVVAVVSAGDFDLLLSADAESEALLPLGLPDVDAMKVPHHGSSDPGLPEVLERLRPELAAIEVGPNTYGHPTPSTLAALERAGVRTYRTDRDGTVTVSVDGGEAVVSTER
jgi:competence protein ComEC